MSRKWHFIAGICIGVAISAGSVAFAEDSLQVELFPSKVHFLLNGTLQELEGSENKDNAVININNKAYISLRSFAESMGATVDYQPASDATGNKHIIDIYSGTSEEDFVVHDPEGYVSLTKINTGEAMAAKNTTMLRISSIMKVEKDLTGKKVQINALDKEGNIIGSLDVDRQNVLKRGDIVNIPTTIYVRGVVDSFEVKVNDTWGLTTSDYFSNGLLFLKAGLVYGKGKMDPNRHGLVQSLYFQNGYDEEMTIDPIHIEYRILNTDGDVLFSTQLAPLQGKIPSFGWYEANLPVWNFKDQNGNPVSPGTYTAEIVVPDSVNYTFKGSDTIVPLSGINLCRYTKWDYDVTQSDIDSTAD